MEPSALTAGFITAALIIPVFVYRHYIQDKGVFPDHMLEDLQLTEKEMTVRKAGIWPYVTLIAGVAVVLIANRIFVLPG